MNQNSWNKETVKVVIDQLYQSYFYLLGATFSTNKKLTIKNQFNWSLYMWLLYMSVESWEFKKLNVTSGKWR